MSNLERELLIPENPGVLTRLEDLDEPSGDVGHGKVASGGGSAVDGMELRVRVPDPVEDPGDLVVGRLRRDVLHGQSPVFARVHHGSEVEMRGEAKGPGRIPFEAFHARVPEDRQVLLLDCRRERGREEPLDHLLADLAPEAPLNEGLGHVTRAKAGQRGAPGERARDRSVRSLDVLGRNLDIERSARWRFLPRTHDDHEREAISYRRSAVSCAD